jgi:hypothetical protein
MDGQVWSFIKDATVKERLYLWSSAKLGISSEGLPHDPGAVAAWSTATQERLFFRSAPVPATRRANQSNVDKVVTLQNMLSTMAGTRSARASATPWH